MKKAVILFSGGLDSTVMLALALSRKKECYPLSFDYGQNHFIELERAEKICAYYKLPWQCIKINLPWHNFSSLTSDQPVPEGRSLAHLAKAGIPSTYVPARNTLFLSYALGFAEMIKACEIHIGCTILDVPNYPDCTPSFIQAYQEVINIGSKKVLEGESLQIIAPLIQWTKSEIYKLGLNLKAPLDLTWSCYNPINNLPCKRCDACVLRESTTKDLSQNS